MKYSRRMNLKVLQVGDAVHQEWAERVLRLNANYEGAHIDSNEMDPVNSVCLVRVDRWISRGEHQSVRTSCTDLATWAHGLHSAAC